MAQNPDRVPRRFGDHLRRARRRRTRVHLGTHGQDATSRQHGWPATADRRSRGDSARWRDSDGLRVTAPQSFATLSDARGYLATVEADQLRRTYRAPRRVTETLAQYGLEWIDTRPGLKDSTRHQYGIDFSRHIEPYLGERLLDKIEPEHVRRWHARLASDLCADLAPSGRDGSATVARAYRLLRAILQTAVDDELLLRNPCRLPGAGTLKSTERPVLAISEVGELAAVVPDHYRAYAALSGLRAGELAALRVRDCVLGPAPSVRVARRFYRVAGRVTVDTPKSDAGVRVVPLPQTVAQEVRNHLARHRADAGPNDFVFVTAGGMFWTPRLRSCDAVWTGSGGATHGPTTFATPH